MKICIIGKSKRLTVLDQNFKALGYVVRTLDTTDKLSTEINDDIIILPIPTLDKSGFLNIDGENKMPINTLLDTINQNSLVISCGFSEQNRRMIDLNSREDFAYLNAVPTAEGAIFYALKHTERSLFESKVLITGFGRVSKLLADRLKGLCKDITVSARSLKDLSYAEALSFDTFHTNELKNNISRFDLIFQTVPSKLITPEIIDNMTVKNIIIELSSKSLGTDYLYAQRKGIKVVHAPALPEKISPITAGNILTKSVLSIISEQNRSVYSE